ncbi:hypothetical protein JCM24511_03997 [Saitozyma sp. JCM 24511]|nr:hypothetical protein JCM24511_03997 [Saitozyma sp. JCM 24511]
MSVELRYGVRSPHENGWVFGDDVVHKHYEWIAYPDPKNPKVFFACHVGAIEEREGVAYHIGCVTPVMMSRMPPRPDYNVWAIPHYEARRLIALERLWWRDYNLYRRSHPDEDDDTNARDYAHSRVIAQDRK